MDQKTKPTLIAVVAVLALLVVGGALWAAGVIRLPGLSSPIVDANRVSQAFQNFNTQTSGDVHAAISFASAPSDAGTDAEAHIGVQADIAGVPLPANTSSQLSMQGNVIVSGTAAGSAVDVQGEFRSIPPKTFVRLTALSPYVDGNARLMGAVLNRWVYAGSGDVAGMGEMMKGLPSVGIPSDCHPTPEQMQAVQNYIRSLPVADFVSNVKNVGSDGFPAGDPDRTATRFALTVDQAKVLGVERGIEGYSGCTLPVPDTDSPEVSIDTFEVLVGDQTGLLRGGNIALTNKDGSHTTVALTLSNFGDKPVVEEPEGAISLQAVMAEALRNMMMGGMMPQTLR